MSNLRLLRLIPGSLILICLLSTVLIGFFMRKRPVDSTQFLHADRSLPGIISALAFLAANCGALEVVGMVAASTKYGVLALHFYWIGAIPAMIFLALFMMPVYSRSRARTIPEFLKMRYSCRVQLLNALSQIVIMVFVAGISLYAISSMLEVFLGWKFIVTSVMISSLVVCYVSLGGLPTTIYSSLLLFMVTLLGLAPLSFLVLERFHGLHGLSMSLPQTMQHAWKGLSWSDPQGSPMDVLGLTAGLGFVLGFGYWCTDFVLMQRAFAARTEEAAMNTPLLAGLGKLVFSFFVVIPGLAASVLLRGEIYNFDHALPRMMLRYYPPGLLGVGITAILASLISALSGNIAAFSTVWTHDIYRAYLVPDRQDRHYLCVGRGSAAIAACLAIGTGYVAFRYKNLMDYLQLVLALFSAPMFAILALGMFTQWATATGAFWGVICGMIFVLLHHLACDLSLLSYGSQMSADFYGAIYGFLVTIVITTGFSLVTKTKSASELEGVTFRWRDAPWRSISPVSLILAGLLLSLCLVLNLWLW